LLHDKQAIVQLGTTRDDFQQGRFASAVAPDQTHALRSFEGKFRVIEQRDVTERELRIREGDDCHKYLKVVGSRAIAGDQLKE